MLPEKGVRAHRFFARSTDGVNQLRNDSNDRSNQGGRRLPDAPIRHSPLSEKIVATVHIAKSTARTVASVAMSRAAARPKYHSTAAL